MKTKGKQKGHESNLTTIDNRNQSSEMKPEDNSLAEMIMAETDEKPDPKVKTKDKLNKKIKSIIKSKNDQLGSNRSITSLTAKSKS
jgi:hypothetical protein